MRVAVFASGGGSNLQALLDHFQHAAAPVKISLVISDREGAGALARAERAGVPTAVVAATGRDAAIIADETLAALAEERIDLIALAGYLRLVPEPVIRAFSGRIINVHPALLPAFGGQGMYGIHVHRAVLAAGCFVTGPTVHYVDERYDEGRIIAQWPVPVSRDDTPETLAARVLRIEHILYPAALALVARSVATGEAARATAGFEPGALAFIAGRDVTVTDLGRTLGLD
jgi:formyltetrahydrofolate-dependent phosphoribosylglycinamide formyltransferase